MKFKIYVNGAYSEVEKALVNVDTNKVVLSGDYYHDKIDEYIKGFLMGIHYAGIKFHLLKSEKIMPGHKMFVACNFYDEEVE